MRRRKWTSTLAIGLVVLLVATASPSADAQPAHTWLRPPNHPGAPQTYHGFFADPSVILVGDTYFAFATTAGGSHLPVLRSTDLRNWSPLLSYNRTTAATRRADSAQFIAGRPIYVARRADRHFDPWINDGLLDHHDSIYHDIRDHHHLRSAYWAPGVAKIGDRFVAFSSVPQAAVHDRRCIRASVSAVASGPYRPVGGSRWLQCDHTSTGAARSPGGSNDPDPFVNSNGVPFLTWMSTGGTSAARPVAIWSRRLAPSGVAFASGSTARRLLRADWNSWEGFVVENPSMIKYRNRYYLFYSGNDYRTADYAIGYAICEGPLGPCERGSREPLMSTTNSRFVGPGGADAFVDKNGHLRIAFHHWLDGTEATRPATAYRMLATARILVNADGTLRVGEAIVPRPPATSGPTVPVPRMPALPPPPPPVVRPGDAPNQGAAPSANPPASPRLPR